MGILLGIVSFREFQTWSEGIRERQKLRLDTVILAKEMQKVLVVAWCTTVLFVCCLPFLLARLPLAAADQLKPVAYQ